MEPCDATLMPLLSTAKQLMWPSIKSEQVQQLGHAGATGAFNAWECGICLLHPKWIPAGRSAFQASYLWQAMPSHCAPGVPEPQGTVWLACRRSGREAGAT